MCSALDHWSHSLSPEGRWGLVQMQNKCLIASGEHGLPEILVLLAIHVRWQWDRNVEKLKIILCVKMMINTPGPKRNCRKDYFLKKKEKDLRWWSYFLEAQKSCSSWQEFKGLCIQVPGLKVILDHSFIHSLIPLLFLTNSSTTTECLLLSGPWGGFRGKVRSEKTKSFLSYLMDVAAPTQQRNKWCKVWCREVWMGHLRGRPRYSMQWFLL